jgi:hypothetical protein
MFAQLSSPLRGLLVVLIFILAAATTASAQQAGNGEGGQVQANQPQPIDTPPAAYGIWVMVNNDVAYDIKPNGTVEILGAGVLMRYQFFEGNQFIMANQQGQVRGAIQGNQMIVANASENAAPWNRQLQLVKADEQMEAAARAWGSDISGRVRAAATLSDDNLIRNQLRSLYNVAQQYMQDTGAEEVTVDDIVGEGKMIDRLPTIAGEDYSDLVFSDENDEYVVTTEAGQRVGIRINRGNDGFEQEQ